MVLSPLSQSSVLPHPLPTLDIMHAQDCCAHPDMHPPRTMTYTKVSMTYMCTHAHVHAHIYIHAHARARGHAHAHMHTCTHAWPLPHTAR